MCVGYKADVIERHFGNGDSFGVSIRYLREALPLGTGGALAQVVDDECSDPFLALNGDSYCAIDFGKILEAHRQWHAIASIAVTRVNDLGRYGSVRLDKTGVVLGFSEKNQTSGVGFVNAGVYVLGHSVLAGVPRGMPVSIEREVFPSLVGRGFFGFVADGEFIDIGMPAEYMRAQDFFAGKEPVRLATGVRGSAVPPFSRMLDCREC
jgi:mannose-1-phosphate guanylyltransferase